jgi:glycosidase
MIKTANPEGIMIAECWDDSREWLTQGDMFDATMHYVLSRNIWNRFCHHKISLEQFDSCLNRSLMLYPERINQVLWTFLGSHDTARLRTRAGGDLHMLHAASFFQFTFPGAPIIYYGDELGMQGGDDPYCRFPMEWHNVEGNVTHAHYRRLAHVRAQSSALRVGSFRTWQVEENGLYAYLRRSDDQLVLCLINTSLEPVSGIIRLPEEMTEAESLHDLYADVPYPVSDGMLKVRLAVGEGAILTVEKK